MSTHVLMVSDAPSIFHPLPEDGVSEKSFLRDGPAMRAMLDEFVSLLRRNSKVWAVYAAEHHYWGISVWTCVDSHDRKDRSPVYSAEWQLLSRYPEVPFDFNVLLCPAGSEQFTAGSFDYVYTR